MTESNGRKIVEAGPSSWRMPSYEDEKTPQFGGVKAMLSSRDKVDEEILRDEEVCLSFSLELSTLILEGRAPRERSHRSSSIPKCFTEAAASYRIKSTPKTGTTPLRFVYRSARPQQSTTYFLFSRVPPSSYPAVPHSLHDTLVPAAFSETRYRR